MRLNCLGTRTQEQQSALRGAGMRRNCAAFTMAEVIISILILGISLGGILGVYLSAAIRSDWSATCLSAQMMALSGLEQCRAAKYDPLGSPATDQLVSSNFPPRVDILDVGSSQGVVAYGTNTTTISTVSTNPYIKMVRIDCVWTFPQRGLFTNSIYTYRAANQ